MLNFNGFRAISWVCVNQMVTTQRLKYVYQTVPIAKACPMNAITVLE
jgi:hypothetical protein